MRISITGATGFIGRRLVWEHLAAGDEVHILTRREGFPDDPRPRLHRGDLATAKAAELEPFVRDADILYHCAGELHDRSRMELTHVHGTRTLLEAAVGQVGRWVQLSSVGVYGQRAAGTITEETAPAPRGEYETTKSRSDDLVREMADRSGLNATILRPSIVFGPGMPGRSLYQLIEMIDRGLFVFVGRPGSSANYIHVQNVVDALVLCGREPAAAGRVYNLSDWQPLEELVKAVARELGRSAPRFRIPEAPLRAVAWLTAPVAGLPLTRSRIDALVNRVIYPSDRIIRELGYQHRIPLLQGFADLARHWRSVQ